MGGVINKTIHHPVVLGTGGYGDTLLITATGAIRPSTTGATALTAPNTLSAAYITNYGEIRGGSGGATVPGGAGIDFASATGSITNAATIIGGHGYYTATGHLGGAGGAGLLSTGAPSVDNSGIISGGSGGSAPAYDAYGGLGGAGVSLAGGTLVNTGSITGGRGGNATYGDAGGGGIGVNLGAAAALDNMDTIRGGAGAVGYFYGGAGGTGVALAANEAASSNAGLIAGGIGGRELTDYTGGNGGVGVTLGINDTFTNTGTILGGHGGYGYSAGNGGDGVLVTGGTLTNAGLIKGGATGGQFAQGGAGVSLNGGVVVDAGTIIAGAGVGGGYPGDGVLFGSAGGEVILETHAKIEGGFGGWGAGDTIDVRTVRASSFSYQNGTLSLLNAQNHVVYTLHFDGTYSSADFALQQDGAGGTDIVFGAAGVAPDYWLLRTLGGGGDASPAAAVAHGSGPLPWQEPDAMAFLFGNTHFSSGSF